ncbi:MAG: hypothetical protein V4689_13180 [Verrucomicrobiota bacterium]
MNPRLENLLNRWLDGELDPPEAAAVQRMLVEDPEARRVYYELLMVDRLLDESINASGPGCDVIDSLADEMVLGRHRARFQPKYLALAAMVALTLFAVFFISRKTPPVHTGPLITGSTDSRMTIAQRQDSSRWAVGELLRLERGTAAIQLNPVVSANFEGPAAIELMDPAGNIRLLEGMASFQADVGGNDFQLDIPGGVVRDMRARFTTEVLSDGVANIRVDSGFLEIHPRGSAEPLRLNSGDAMSLEGNGKTLPIRLPNQYFRSGLPEQVTLFSDDFHNAEGIELINHRPRVGQTWQVLAETSPPIIRNQTLDTSTGPRRLLGRLAPHNGTAPRTVYICTFHLVPPARLDDKVTRQGGVEFISLADDSGQPVLSIFAEASNSHRWQLRDERSKAVTALTQVCALWTHSLTLCYDLGGRVTLHDGATAQAPIISEMRVADPRSIAGIVVGNRDGGDLAFAGIEASLLPAPPIKQQ